MSLLLATTPADFGLPEKFAEFRPTQAEALDFILGSNKPFIASQAPTGIGKSLIATSAAVTTGSKAVYLTATKALQAQIQDDFKVIGMKDIRGRNNYPCSVYTTKLKRNVSCQEGYEQSCWQANTLACPYAKAYDVACSAQLISTNYSYWLHARKNSVEALEALNEDKIELLICDEAHDAMEELARFLAVHVPKESFDAEMLPKGNGTMDEAGGRVWINWATERVKEVNTELLKLKTVYGSVAVAKQEEGEKYAELERIKRKLDQIKQMGSDWVWETNDNGVSFECIWPGRYSHMLWSGVPKVLLLSATLWPYTLGLLGLSKDQYDYRAFSNGWPPNRGPVYYLPTVKLNVHSSDEDYRTLVAQIDAIIDARLDRKGIIHTVSYARMRTVLKYSRHRRIMHYNDTAGDSVIAADKYRRAAPPAVLISPSYGTGWDFAYDQCEYQIIPKIPFPFSESRVMQERIKVGEYRNYLAMLAIRQMIGRGRRASDDRCETYILDKAWSLLLHKGRQFVDKGYSIHRISELPPKPQKLKR